MHRCRQAERATRKWGDLSESIARCSCPFSMRNGTSAPAFTRCSSSDFRARSSSCSWTAVRPTGRARSCPTWRAAIPGCGCSTTRADHAERAQHRSRPRPRSLGGANGRPHRVPPRLPRARRRRLRRGDTRWVSGPQVATGDGPVSRAVALALRTPLGRGGSRKWGTSDGAVTEEYELDSGVFAGVWERDTLLEYGGWDEGWPRNQDSEMAGRFLARGERLICLPRWPPGTRRATRSSRCGASTSSTATTARRPLSVIHTRCAARI